MNRLIALVLVGGLFSGNPSGEGGGWIDGWLKPDPGLFFWTLVTFHSRG